jgi:hypothetical protein
MGGEIPPSWDATHSRSRSPTTSGPTQFQRRRATASPPVCCHVRWRASALLALDLAGATLRDFSVAASVPHLVQNLLTRKAADG